MKQPKTVEEFMALPVRGLFAWIEEQLPNGQTFRRPRMRSSRAMYHESDTVFYCGGFILGLDDEGYFRRSL